MKTAAIVVTYNRKELLKENIECLLAQKPVVPAVIVVDNHSTDGTKAYIQEYIDRGEIVYRDTGANLGGAGGFNYGMRWAVEAGYEYLWVMDDDCMPEPDALEKLLNADALLKGEYGWLSSVVLWTDGTECRMNRQKLRKSIPTEGIYREYDLKPARQATFVSLLLRAEIIRRVGLPVKEFFIWGDDIEYTRRIAVRAKIPSFVAGQSRVIHAMKENTGSSIATDRAERIDRYRYAFRNEAYTYRKEGLGGVFYYLAKCGLNLCRIVVKAPDHRGKRIRVLLESMVKGARFRPQVEEL